MPGTFLIREKKTEREQGKKAAGMPNCLFSEEKDIAKRGGGKESER